MNKATFCFLALPLLLSGCTGDLGAGSSSLESGASSPSISLPSSSEEGSSPSEPESSPSEGSSSSSEEESVEAEVNAFIASLERYRGHPYEVSGSVTMTLGYLTDADPITITSSDEFTTTRYEGYVTERIGEVSYELSDPEPYVTTTFVEGESVYRVTVYEDESRVVEEVAFAEETIEANVAIDFATSQVDNLLFLLSVYDLPGIGYTLDLPRVEGDGTYAFSYSLTEYEEGTDIPSEVITHENEMTIENGIIVSSKSTVDNSLYAGGVRANWQVSTSEVTYTEGAYPTFEGTLPEIEK